MIVKNLPVMQKTQVWSLGWDDPLEKGMATRSSILDQPKNLQGKNGKVFLPYNFF